MSILNKILGFFAAIAGVFSAVFYVLFQQKKNENEEIKKDLEETKKTADNNAAIIQAEQEAEKKVNEVKKENEELRELSKSDTLSGFAAACELLRK